MNDKEYEQLKKDVNYANMEGLIPEGKELLVFRNTEEAIQALRDNKIPNIIWDEECEKRYLDMLNKESGATE
jgi:SpoU rRNA methylase family enzyme